MIHITIEQIAWIILFFFQLSIAGYLYSVYRKDKQLNKLMFSISLFAVAYSHFYEGVLAYVLTTVPDILTNIQYWSFYPLIIIVAVAMHKTWFKKMKPRLIFHWFIALSLVSFLFITFFPLPAEYYAGTFALIISLELIITGIIVTYKSRVLSDIILFLGWICIAVGSYGLLFASYRIIFFGYFLGNILIFLVFYTPTKKPDSTSSGLFHYFILEQELARTKTSLTETEECFKTLFNEMVDPVAIVNRTGKILEVSDQLLEITGTTREEIIGTSFLKTPFFDDETKRTLIKNVALRMMGKKLAPYEIFVYTKDGKKYPFEIHAGKVHYKGAAADMAVFRDVSERKKHEDDLRVLSNFAFTYLDVTADVNIYKDVCWKIKELIGPGIVGVSSIDDHDVLHVQELVGLNESMMKRVQQQIGEQDINGPIHGITDEARKALLTGKLTPLEGGLYQLQFGKISRPMSAIIEKILHITTIYTIGLRKEKKIYGSIAILATKESRINVTIIETLVTQASTILEKREAWQQLQKAHKEIETMNRQLESKVRERTSQIHQLLHQKDEFIHQLGHDLKNPLNPMMNLLPIIHKHVTNPDDQMMVEVVQRNVRYIKNLVDKTLQLARLNSPSVELTIEQVPVANMVDKILENNQYLLQKYGIQVDQQIPRDMMVKADKILLTEVFTNLLTNAIKYSPTGGLVRIRGWEQQNSYTFFVQDPGQGMTKEQLGCVFTEFYKADASRHDFDSSGLGLSICKRIVEQHGGEIWAESDGLGKGATIYFTLAKDPERFRAQQLNIDEDITQKVDMVLERYRKK